MSTAWISTVVRWTAVVLIFWMGYQSVPSVVDQLVDWRREESCINRDMSWQQVGWGTDEYECVEKVNENDNDFD